MHLPALFLSHAAVRRRQLTRLLAPFALALGLLWVASPLLQGQQTRRRIMLNAYQRYQNLRLQQLCRSHLQRISLALALYTSDNDGHLPTLVSPEKLHEQLAHYRLSSGNFICPVSNKEYQINKSLSGKKMKAIPNAGKTLLMWSTRPLPDGYYMILTANGQNRRVTAGELSRYRK
ncbi:MAG TPA: hypothetical protein VFB38_05985 [Chthonomonadaceae bacterium]|nr:hypothetical protein [Chthonomonadaceae bacterium]